MIQEAGKLSDKLDPTLQEKKQKQISPTYRLWTRLTQSSETHEGLQRSNIQVYIYDSEEIAWSYFSKQLSLENWQKAVDSGEVFFYNETESFKDTFFLEIRKIMVD